MANTGSGGDPRRHVVGSDAFFRAQVETRRQPVHRDRRLAHPAHASESITRARWAGTPRTGWGAASSTCSRREILEVVAAGIDDLLAIAPDDTRRGSAAR